MLKHISILFLLLGIIQTSTAQKIQWAGEVVSYSSSYNNGGKGEEKAYSAHQVLGVPNAIGPEVLSQWAWQPKKHDAGSEYIRVKFNSPQRGVRQVYISESLNPGAISKVFLFDTKGKKHEVYENKNPTPLMPQQRFRMLKIKVASTSYYVKECLVELKTNKIPGPSFIDAIGITDHYGDIKIKGLINELTYSHPVEKPRNLGQSVNSGYSERLPIISPDGNTLFFTRKKHPENLGGEGQDDIWVSYKTKDGRWSLARNVGEPLNTDWHNFAVATNPNGTNLYVGNDYSRARSKDGFSVSKLRNGVWQMPKNMPIEDHYNDNIYVEYHVSVDENFLLMSVERKEGFGERDLYVSFRRGNGWTKPRNLGNTINTSCIESSVFLAADGKTLYFASNGHYNYGGLDIFMSRRLDDSWTKWTEPQNLGPKINTQDNDFNYTIPAAGDYAYFSSGYNTYGMSDLFRIRLPEEARPEPVMLMTGQIIDVSTNKPIQAKIKYNSLDDDKKDDKENEALADDDGSYQMVLPYGDDVEVYADIEGYFSVSQSMELSGEEIEELDSDRPEDLAASGNLPEAKDEEMDELESELQRLNRELAELKKKREEIKNKPRTRPSDSPRRDDNLGLKPSNNYKPKPKAGRDSELEYLKQKYYSKVQNRPNSSSELHSPKPNTESKAKPKEDKELNSLYSKFDKYKQDEPNSGKGELNSPQSQEESIVDESNSSNSQNNLSTGELNTPQPRDESKAKPKPKADGELNDLYSKFNKYKDDEHSTGEFNSPQPQDESITTTSREKPRNKPFYSTDKKKDEPITEVPENTLADNQPTFEELEEKVRTELREELEEEVKAELKLEWLQKIKAELNKEADEEEKDLIADVVMEKQVELNRLKPSSASIKPLDPIEEELKALIIADVKEELKEELAEPIKEELKEEVVVETKEKKKDEVQQRMEDWKKRRSRNNSSVAVKPKPKPRKDPEYVELNQNIEVVPIKVGQVIPMNNIFFDANKSSIKEQSTAELERVLGFLKKNGSLIVEVGGHTNGWCSSTFAFELSSARAKAVRKYFTDNGVPTRRIQFRGYGKTVPIADNNTSAGRKKNQRVELKILEILD